LRVGVEGCGAGAMGVEAQAPDVFFKKLVKSQDWPGTVSGVEKPDLSGESWSYRLEVQREVGLSMAEARPEVLWSQNLGL